MSGRRGGGVVNKMVELGIFAIFLYNSRVLFFHYYYYFCAVLNFVS